MVRKMIVALSTLLIMTVAVGCSMVPTTKVQAGTTFNQSSQNLTVSGTNFVPLAPVYIRVASNSAFNTTTLHFMLERKKGASWVTIMDDKAIIVPNYTIAVDTFHNLMGGSYQVDVVDNGKVIGTTSFVIK